MDMCNAFFPLLRPHARVVNVASRLGLLNKIINSDLKAKLSNPNATVEDIVNVMNQYVKYKHGLQLKSFNRVF